MSNQKFRQPRESRIIGGLIALVLGVGVTFFSSLFALESFADAPVGASLFLLLGVTTSGFGLYFLTCVPEMTIDADKRALVFAKSCVITLAGKSVPFDDVQEVGLRERYVSGDYTEQSGTFYSVEIRSRDNIEVPGTTHLDINHVASAASDIANQIGVRCNTKSRKVFTGSLKVGA